ncbi:MAG: cobyrinate a,c-diamide synthase, partial [Candidatus Omnitrophica bacterium]|nr:cobyrinate a,c-diamide synthase [Candidatus Omnitrophota bacterium]
MIKIPRLLIAGTHSGVGKTTVAVGLMAALRQQGISIQPFKVGPDYIDPSYHTLATGRVSRNLDTWFLTDRQVRQVFQHAGTSARLAVIEGVMGLFDGHAGTNDRGSTAELAKWLQVPVILVVDGSHMARSIAAMVQGYLAFDPQVRIAGIIVNNVSARHGALLREALQRSIRCPMLGSLPFDPTLAIPERHLGLIPAQEDSRLAPVIKRLADAVKASINLDAVKRLANRAPTLPLIASSALDIPQSGMSSVCTIGVARDRAFHFYYQENLDLLHALGAELIEFSPLEDANLPGGLDALYLGGGFPELFAGELAQNGSLRGEIKRAVDAGLPTYGECGGLMYLAQRLIDAQGKPHPMVGALPGTIRMTSRLQHFGYATIRPQRDTILAKAHDPIKGHEFHYSCWEHQVPSRHAAYTVLRRREPTRLEG